MITKVLSLLLTVPLLLSGCMSTESNTATNEVHDYSSITFKEFFPSVSGNIADYSIQLPADYTQYVIPSGFKKSDTIWGTGADLKSIVLADDTYDFTKATSPMFKVSFTANVGVKNGAIVDPSGPVTQQGYEQQGVTKLKFMAGEFHGFAGVPALALSGELNGEQIYLAYIYSPADDLVMFVLLQGNRTGSADDQAWETFVHSLDIQ